MNKYMVMLGVGLALIMAGCATSKPGYVGTWECKDVPADVVDDGIKAMAVYFTEQGGFSLVGDAADGTIAMGGNGSWMTNATGGIDIEADGETFSGQLLDEDTLLIANHDDAVKFSRKKNTP